MDDELRAPLGQRRRRARRRPAAALGAGVALMVVLLCAGFFLWPARTVGLAEGLDVAVADDVPALRPSAEPAHARAVEVEPPPPEPVARGRMITPQSSEGGPLIIKVPRGP